MDEFLFYVGIVLSVTFFILSVILFFTQRIPSVIRFLLKISNRKPIKVSKKESTTVSTRQAINDTGTELLQDQTELLNIAQNFATALLDVENVHNLEPMNEPTSTLQ
jgi:hypothetical protein